MEEHYTICHRLKLSKLVVSHVTLPQKLVVSHVIAEVNDMFYAVIGGRSV